MLKCSLVSHAVLAAAFMSDSCPTVIIVTENGPVIINESDYDPAVHTLAEGQTAPAAPVSDPATPPAPAASTPAPAASEPLPASEPPAPAAVPQRLVAKIGSKHFVVDEKGAKVEGEGIDPNGYKSAQDAWAAVLPK
jgi:hypothetical protein